MTNATEKKKAEVQPDVMPPPIEDVTEPTAPAPARAESESGDEQEQAQVRPELIEDKKREEIAQLYRDKRDQEEADLVQARAELATAKSQAREADPGQPGQPAQRVKIVVDGREEYLPLDEVTRRAQINSASDNRLEEAKRILNEAKALRSQSPSVMSGHQPEPEYPRHAGTPHSDRLRDIAERIQVGDVEEGAQALGELLSSQEIDRRVDARLLQTQTETEMTTALNRFIGKHPDVARDPDLGQAGFSVLARTIAEDLKKLGATDEVLAPLRTDVKALAHAAAALRRAGHKIRSFDQFLDSAGETLSRKFGFKNTSSSDDFQRRTERKRAMPSQPRSAAVRFAPSAETRRPKTAQEIVAEQRRARGFPSNG